MRKLHFLLSLILIFALAGCSIPGLPIPSPSQELPTETLPPSMEPQLTYTPTQGVIPSVEVPIPSATTAFTPTATEILATATITPTPLPPVTFFIQTGTPLGVANFLAPEMGCNWMGIAGQVFGLDSVPEDGMVIQLQGAIEGRSIDDMAVTQVIPALGPGAYQFIIADHPIESNGSLWIQVFDQAGVPKTGKILLLTYADCEHNLVLVNFAEGLPVTNEVRLPLILRQAGGAP